MVYGSLLEYTTGFMSCVTRWSLFAGDLQAACAGVTVIYRTQMVLRCPADLQLNQDLSPVCHLLWVPQAHFPKLHIDIFLFRPGRFQRPLHCNKCNPKMCNRSRVGGNFRLERNMIFSPLPKERCFQPINFLGQFSSLCHHDIGNKETRCCIPFWECPNYLSLLPTPTTEKY